MKQEGSASVVPVGLSGKSFVEIHVSAIRESRTNPRKTYDEASLEELAASIRENGLLQPIVVRSIEDGYEVVFGHRRLRAFQKIDGDGMIPAIIESLDDVEVMEAQIVENSQRADVDPLEEADAYERLHVRGKRTIGEVAASVGRTPRYVAERIALTTLSPRVRAGRLMPGTSLSCAPVETLAQLAKLSPDAQDQVVQEHQLDTVDTYGHGPRFILPETIQKAVDEEIRKLGMAPWDLFDEKLVADAGPCSKCLKTTAAAPDLFGSSAGKDLASSACRDSACWARKYAAQGARQIVLLREKHPDLIFVADGSSHDELAGIVPEGSSIVASYDVVKAKKGEAGAVPSTNFALAAQGKVNYVRPVGATAVRQQRAQKKKAGELPIAEVLAEKEERLSRKRDAAFVDAVQAKIDALVEGQVKDPAPCPDEFFEQIPRLAAVYNGRAALERGIAERYEATGDPEVFEFGLSMISSSIRRAKNVGSPELAVEAATFAAKILDIDVATIEAEIEEAIPTPKSIEKLRRGDSPKTEPEPVAPAAEAAPAPAKAEKKPKAKAEPKKPASAKKKVASKKKPARTRKA